MSINSAARWKGEIFHQATCNHEGMNFMTAATILPEVTKRIAYNRTTKDYDCFVSIDGDPEQYIGSAEVYSDAEAKCRDYAFHYYDDNHTPEKAAQIAMADELPEADQTTDWHYAHGAASLTIEEDADTEIVGGSLVIGRHTVRLTAEDVPALRDLAALLHGHCAQNTLRMYEDAHERPPALTLSHLNPEDVRDRFDNGCFHEYETYLCEAMTRMGLSYAAMRDLFEHIRDIAQCAETQGFGRGVEARIAVEMSQRKAA
jgi:hypothetical protein